MASFPQPERPAPVLPGWVRGTLVLLAGGLMAVFAIALWLRPYDTEGRPLRMETHRQLGLAPCTFYTLTGLPCPSCGMTTSFALLAHGDLGNSLRANAVGTLLAVFCLFLVPWSLAGALRGRMPFCRSLERFFTRAVIVFLVLLLVRWIVVLGMGTKAWF
jgi:hypothetical protein